MGFIDEAQKWALQELADVKRVPVTLIVAAMIAASIAWVVAKEFYAERIYVLSLLAEAKLAAPLPPRQTWTWRGLAIVGAFGLLALMSAMFALKNRRVAREVANLKRRIDVLQDSAVGREKERDILNALVDGHRNTMKEMKHAYAMGALRRQSERQLAGEPKGVTPSVTVRYCSYGQDDELALRLKALFKDEVKWPVVMDASNNPALERAKGFKVVFDIGFGRQLYGDLISAFMEGDLLGVPVAWHDNFDREDSRNLIVKVLPSADSFPATVALGQKIGS